MPGYSRPESSPHDAASRSSFAAFAPPMVLYGSAGSGLICFATNEWGLTWAVFGAAGVITAALAGFISRRPGVRARSGGLILDVALPTFVAGTLTGAAISLPFAMGPWSLQALMLGAGIGAVLSTVFMPVFAAIVRAARTRAEFRAGSALDRLYVTWMYMLPAIAMSSLAGAAVLARPTAIGITYLVGAGLIPLALLLHAYTKQVRAHRAASAHACLSTDDSPGCADLDVGIGDEKYGDCSHEGGYRSAVQTSVRVSGNLAVWFSHLVLVRQRIGGSLLIGMTLCLALGLFGHAQLH